MRNGSSRAHGALRPEAAAHVGSRDPHRLEVEFQGFGEALPHTVRHLRARPEMQLAGRRVPPPDGSPRLQRQRGEATAAKVLGHDERGLPQGFLEVPGLQIDGCRHIGLPVVVDERRVGVDGSRRIDRGHQRLVLDTDDFRRISGPVRIDSDHHRHRLSHVAHEAVSEGRLPIGLDGGSGDEGRRKGAAQFG
jgi:hypothetical protein